MTSVMVEFILLLFNLYNKINKPIYTIAIIQSASYQALNDSRDCVMQTIIKNIFHKVMQFLLYNIQEVLGLIDSLCCVL